MPTELLGPFRLDRRDASGVQAVGLDQLGRHHPLRRPLGQHRAGSDHEASVAGTHEVAGASIAHTDVREQPGEHRPVDVIGPRVGFRGPQPELAGDASELAVEIDPFANTQVVDVLTPAEPAEGVARQRPLPVAQVVPERDDRQQVGPGDVEPPVQFVGAFATVGGTLAHVLHRECGGDDEHLTHTSEATRFEDHPAEPRVDRKPGQPTSRPGQSLVRGDRRQLLEECVAVADGRRVGRLEKRETSDVAEADRGHLEDHRGKARSEYLRLGELRASLEILLGVEADADSGSDAPAPARALVGRRLRDRLYRETLHLEPARVPRDARRTRVDDIADARDGDRGLGDVCRQHDAARFVRATLPEDPVLLGCREAGIERQHLQRTLAVEAPQSVGGVVDLALARQEDEHVARTLCGEFVDGVDDRLHLIAVVARIVVGPLTERPVPHLDRVGAAGDLDDGGGNTTGREVPGEPVGVDRRRRDDHLQIGSLRQQFLQVAEDEVDVEAPLVRLVDDQRVVLTQRPVALDLGEEDAVGHHLDERRLADMVGEPHRVPDIGAER